VKLFAIWVALVVLAAPAGSAAGAEPQPDAAPQAPAVTPDPAPGAVQESAPPAQQPPPTPPAQTQPSAAAPAQEPSPPSQARRQPSKPVAKHHHARTKARADSNRATPPRAGSTMRIRALLPHGESAGDSSSHVILLAAGALLALVLASGSMLSVSSRAMKGQLR